MNWIVLFFFLSLLARSVAADEPSPGPYHLIFGIGLHDEGAFTPVGQSDGMTFIVELRCDNETKEIFRRHRPKENHAPEYFSADMSPWAGRTIRLRFIADPGPNHNAAYDWGVWIEPRIVRGVVPPKWWERKNLFQSDKLRVIFDAVDSYEKATLGVGDKIGLRAGAQFNPCSVPIGWGLLGFAEKYSGKKKVRGILHEPAWDNEATLSWAQYTLVLNLAGTLVSSDTGSNTKRMDTSQAARAVRRLDEAATLGKELDALIARGRRQGLQMRMPRVTAAVLKVFVPRLREDLDGIAWYCGPNFPGWFYNKGTPPGYVTVKVKMAEKSPKDIYPPAFIEERKQRGILLAPYLVQTAGRALAEAREILAHPEADVKFPEYDMGKLKIRDGYFYDGDQPALLTGLYTNRDVKQDYDAISEMGICFTQPERLNVFTTLVGEQETSRGFIDSFVVRDTLEPAGKANIGCLFDLGLHYLPEWAYKKYPDLTNPGSDHNHYAPYLVTSKGFRDVVRWYLDQLVPTTAKFPMTLGYEMGNQPFLNPWSPAVIRQFQDWAKMEYKTIDAANQQWLSTFTSFSQVQPDKNFRLIQPVGLRYDWVKFQHRITGEWYRWLKAELNKHDPHGWVEVQPAGNFFDPQKFPGHDAHRVAIDEVDLYRNITDISGIDACTWFWGRLVYDQGGQFYDLLRSIAPAKPIVNFEYGLSTYNSKTIWDPAYIRGSLWYSYLHGMGGCTTWIWTLAEERDETQTNTLARWPDRIETFGRTALELRRHARAIAAFGRPSSEVAMLYPAPARWFAGTGPSDYFEQARAMWNAASFLDTSFDFITDEQITEGRLTRYKILLIPSSPYMQDGSYRHIQKFVHQGGILLTNGGLGFDAYGHSRETEDFLGSARNADHYAVAREAGKKFGRGIVYNVLPTSAGAYGLLFRRIYDQAGISRPVRVKMQTGLPNWTIEARTVKETDRANQYLFYCFNLGNRAEQILITLQKGMVIAGRDLISNRKFEPVITLNPLEICMWRFVKSDTK